MASDESLLTLTAAVAVRSIAIANLDRAAEAAERFRVSEDPEALHDFRVGLRRLRATVRGHRELLEKVVPKKARRALRDLAEASTLARDTEVQLGWLAQQRESLSANERAGYRWLHRHWQTQLLAEYLQLRDRIGEEFVALERRLRRQLEAPIEAEAPGFKLEHAVAASLAQVLPLFAESLTSLAESVDPQLIHPPRLIGKRLRYLIDPLAPEMEGAREAARALGKLQDLLGDIHDRQVLQPALLKAAEAAGAARYRLLIEVAVHQEADAKALSHARRGAEAAGLVALARRAREEESRLMDELRRWISGGAPDALIRRLRQLQAGLGTVEPSCETDVIGS